MMRLGDPGDEITNGNCDVIILSLGLKATTMSGTELEKVSTSKAFGGDLIKYQFKAS